MKTIRQAVLAATILAAASANAQASDASVARLVDVSGNVLVSRDFNIASAGESARLAPGARVLATANARAVIEFDAGCRVTVEAGQRVEVRPDACLRAAQTLVAALSTDKQ